MKSPSSAANSEHLHIHKRSTVHTGLQYSCHFQQHVSLLYDA